MSKIMLKVEQICLMLLGLVMSLVMFVNACSRYFFSNTFLWAEETVRICFVWAMFIAISELFIYGGHIGFDVFSEKNQWTKKISKAVTNLVLIVLGFNFVFYGRLIIMQVGSVPLASTKLPSMVFYIPGILAGVVWMIIGVWGMVRLFLDKELQEEEGAGE